MFYSSFITLFQIFYPEFDFDANTQTVECVYDPVVGGKWKPTPYDCEPLKCEDAELAHIFQYKDNTEFNVEYSPSDTIFQYFETVVSFNCPKNISIPDMLLDEMSLDYSNSFGIVQQVNLTCGLDE